MIKKILVGVDGSEHSEKAANFALDMAKSLGAELVLLYVGPIPIINMLADFPTMITPNILPEQLEEALQKHGTEIINALKEKYIDSGVNIVARMEIGHPGPTICAVSDDLKPDMVVVGSRGYSGITGMLLGSVSNYLTHSCNYPLLIIK